MDMSPDALRIGAIKLIILICSFVLHEWGHAYAADKLGDDTPRKEGRVTLNPIVHIDLIGSIILPLMGFLGMFGSLGILGWAKPVYTNPANFRRGYFDQALVTLAGPAMNLVLALIGTIGKIICLRLHQQQLVGLFDVVIEMNIFLTVLNMLPIPPLDGSKFLLYLGAMREETFVRFSMFGGFLLLILFQVPPFRRLLVTLATYLYIPFEWLVFTATR